MSHLYFDESIQERGQFIIGALVISDGDLAAPIHRRWLEMGLNPSMDEYKSSTLKANNAVSQAQRAFIGNFLQQCDLALTVAPLGDRRHLGTYCADLVGQLRKTGLLLGERHDLYVDENIRFRRQDRARLEVAGLTCHINADSRAVAGIQVADHTAHSLGGMLLEGMGIVKKHVRAGEDSGYHPEELLRLGFELWASLRHALVGKNEYIEGLSPPPDDLANPYFRVDGYGLYVAPSCCAELAEHARKRFGVNYLGCIH